jgi:hypothetical protein
MKNINIFKFINLVLAFLWIYQGLVPNKRKYKKLKIKITKDDNELELE